jgi:hypothetical protein
MFIAIQYRSDLLEFFGADADSDISFSVGIDAIVCVENKANTNTTAVISAFIFFLSLLCPQFF